MIKPWKILRSHYAVNSRWIRVKRETVQFPNGRIIDDFYYIKGNPIVAVLVIDDHQRVLLVRQYRHAVRDITIDIPGGGVRKGETLKQTAKREVLEETGYKIKKLSKLLTYYSDSGKKGDIKHLFVAHIKSKDRKLKELLKGEEEVIEYFWKPLSQLYKELRQGRIKEATLALALLLNKKL